MLLGSLHLCKLPDAVLGDVVVSLMLTEQIYCYNNAVLEMNSATVYVEYVIYLSRITRKLCGGGGGGGGGG